MSINERTDLIRKYVAVADLFEDTPLEGLEDTKGVRFRGEPPVAPLKFDADPENYVFAVGVLEGEAVFPGDTLYSKVGGHPFEVAEDGRAIGVVEYGKVRIVTRPGKWAGLLSITKNVITINGKELPTPKPAAGVSIPRPGHKAGHVVSAAGEYYFFETQGEAIAFRDILNQVIQEAINAK